MTTYPPLWSAEVEARVRSEAKNLDEQTQPTEVKFCTRCVMSNQRPRIVFDEQGVCSACVHAERKKNGIDWDARYGELADLCERHRSTTGEYDCVVPCSGGKDSSFVAWTLKHEFNMNPLCATWAPHMYTEVGWQNMQAFIHSGFDVVMAQPNGLLHRKFARLGLELGGDPFLPFIYGQLAWPMHVAVQNDITLVFGGENGEAEYGGDPAANERPGWATDDWERVYMKGLGVSNVRTFGYDVGALSDDEYHKSSTFYDLPPLHELDETEYHWLGYYLPWHPQKNYYHAAEHTGFQVNPAGRSEGTYSKYASIDDKLDGLHYYMGYIKFGIGRCTSDAAHEVRDGEITREEAVALVKKYDGEYPNNHINEWLSYLGMGSLHFTDLCKRFRPEHLWASGPMHGWQLKHAVWHADETARRAS